MPITNSTYPPIAVAIADANPVNVFPAGRSKNTIGWCVRIKGEGAGVCNFDIQVAAFPKGTFSNASPPTREQVLSQPGHYGGAYGDAFHDHGENFDIWAVWVQRGTTAPVAGTVYAVEWF